jgi:hypothetical protein
VPAGLRLRAHKCTCARVPHFHPRHVRGQACTHGTGPPARPRGQATTGWPPAGLSRRHAQLLCQARLRNRSSNPETADHVLSGNARVRLRRRREQAHGAHARYNDGAPHRWIGRPRHGRPRYACPCPFAPHSAAHALLCGRRYCCGLTMPMAQVNAPKMS